MSFLKSTARRLHGSIGSIVSGDNVVVVWREANPTPGSPDLCGFCGYRISTSPILNSSTSRLLAFHGQRGSSIDGGLYDNRGFENIEPLAMMSEVVKRCSGMQYQAHLAWLCAFSLQCLVFHNDMGGSTLSGGISSAGRTSSAKRTCTSTHAGEARVGTALLVLLRYAADGQLHLLHGSRYRRPKSIMLWNGSREHH